MSEVMKYYENIAWAEGFAESLAERRAEGLTEEDLAEVKRKGITRLFQRGGTKEQAKTLLDATDDEIAEALKELTSKTNEGM